MEKGKEKHRNECGGGGLGEDRWRKGKRSTEMNVEVGGLGEDRWRKGKRSTEMNVEVGGRERTDGEREREAQK